MSVILLDLKAARAVVGNPSRSTFYEGVAEGRFPQPVRIGPQAVRWAKHELEDCVRAMLEARPKRKR
jgi:predicted DNA-binding transcriptional regulator AlpA